MCPAADDRLSSAQNRMEEAWPPLPLQDWRDTYGTLHRMTQVVGKIRLACAPPVNHWWHVPLYVTARGLTTSAMPHGTGTFQIDFDFIDHVLRIQECNGAQRVIGLRSMPIAEFYRMVMAALSSLDLPVRIWTKPVEIEDPIAFLEDLGVTVVQLTPEERAAFRAATQSVRDRWTQIIGEDLVRLAEADKAKANSH